MHRVLQSFRPIHAVVGLLALAVAGQSVLVYQLVRKDNDRAEAPQNTWHVATSHQADPNASMGAAPQALGSPWDPFAEMDRMQQRMDAIMNRAFGGPMPNMAGPGTSLSFGPFGATMMAQPTIDVEDKGDRYEITVSPAGGDNGSINAAIDGQLLTISGSQSTSNSNQQQGASQSVNFTGTFQRTLTLPEPVDAASMQTTFEDDACTITIPKAQ